MALPALFRAGEWRGKMKRLTALLIPLLLLVVLVVVVAAELPRAPQLPRDVQARLDQYIAYSYPPGTVTVHSAERARRAWRFSEDMSESVFGDSVHFQTDTGPTHTGRLNLSSLYYPPKEAWCVLLEIAGSAGDVSYAVVFVGLHMDMYNADLVVHEGVALSSPEFLDNLTTIGCDLGMAQAGPQQ
jgi:hypothetical protein